MMPFRRTPSSTSSGGAGRSLNSFRAQLTILMVALVAAAAGTLGWLAYDTAHDSIKQDALLLVATAADARELALVSLLERQQARAENFLSNISAACQPAQAEQIDCMRRLLSDFAATEQLKAARLKVAGIDSPVSLGAASPPTAALQAEQLAWLQSGPDGAGYWVLAAQDDLRLALFYRLEAINQIFRGGKGLGRSGEVFLADPHGFFVTPPRHAEPSGASRPIEAEPMRLCLAGRDDEMLAADYRGVEVIHGFRHVPAIGGGCIMAHIETAEALAPVAVLRQESLLIAVAFSGAALLAAGALARRFAQPVDKLTQRVRALQSGDFDSPVPREGPAELRLFAASLEQMARSLRESQMRNQAVLQNALDAVVGMDAEGRVSDWNAQAEVIFGWKREEALGQPMQELIIPERYRESHVRGLAHYLGTGEHAVLNRRIEITALRRSGEEFPVELTVTPLREDSGHFFYAFVRDLSEVKRAQAERGRLQRLGMTVNNNATSALFLMDARQHCTYMNPAAEKMTGFTLAEVQGRPLHEFVHYLHPDGRPYPIQDCPIDRALPQNNQERGEDVFIHKDGRFYNVAFTASPIIDEGEPVGTVIEVHDITEEKRQQKERQRAQERQSFLMEASTLLAESLELEGTLGRVARLAVPRFADLCSVRILQSERELPPLAVAYADSAKEAWVEQLLGALTPDPTLGFGAAEVIRSGTSQLIPEVSGAMRQALVRSYPALEPAVKELGLVSMMAVPMKSGGQLLGVISLATTAVSGRRFDQDDLAFAEEFARRCAAAVENARLFQQVQEGVRLRDEFLSIASHELKTPLTPLQLQVQTILRRAAQLTRDDEARQWLEQRLATLQRQGERLNRLVDELLDISRLARGRLQLNLETVELAAVVNEVVATLHSQGEMDRHGAQVSVSVEPGIIGQWDRLRLEQVIINLLTNALKYGEGSPVTITGRAQGEEATFTVADKGMGIPEAHQQRIFERFERAASATHYGGLGLGLYIVHQVVSALGGSIAVQSAPGQGAAFTVTLPLSGPASSSAEGEEQ